MFVAPRALLAPIPALRQGAILVFCKVMSLVLSFSVDFSVAKSSVVKMCSNQLSIEKLENEASGFRKGIKSCMERRTWLLPVQVLF